MIKEKIQEKKRDYKSVVCIDCKQEIEWWNIWEITNSQALQFFNLPKRTPLCQDCYRKRLGIAKKEQEVHG